MQRAIRAVFYRGGTSKGLFFHASDISPFSAKQRDDIILSAMGSPDPDERQIDGMGGGISSLSKIAVLSTPGDVLHRVAPFSDGIDWADDKSAASSEQSGWDVVYRFAQVGVRERVVDWGSTCGNLVAAAAHFAIDEGLVTRQIEASMRDQSPLQEPLPFTVRVLAANSGKVVRATVPIFRTSSVGTQADRWMVSNAGDASISGVPGMTSPVDIENPLQGKILPTGNVIDYISVDGKQFPCTIVDAGLPSIFVPHSAVFSDLASFLRLPAELDNDPNIPSRLEAFRQAASQLTPSLSTVLSPSAPKVCVVGPPSSYSTTAGTMLRVEDMDCTIRAVSVGNFHRTVPATMLSALAVASALPGSVIATHSRSRIRASSHKRTLIVGHPAGLAEATAALDDKGVPVAISYVRTARRLFQGEVLVRDP